MNFLFVKGFFIRNKKIIFLLFLVKNNGVYFDVKQKNNAPWQIKKRKLMTHFF